MRSLFPSIHERRMNIFLEIVFLENVIYFPGSKIFYLARSGNGGAVENGFFPKLRFFVSGICWFPRGWLILSVFAVWIRWPKFSFAARTMSHFHLLLFHPLLLVRGWVGTRCSISKPVWLAKKASYAEISREREKKPPSFCAGSEEKWSERSYFILPFYSSFIFRPSDSIAHILLA